jgi:hypothetical protein
MRDWQRTLVNYGLEPTVANWRLWKSLPAWKRTLLYEGMIVVADIHDESRCVERWKLLKG